ncbi:MAG: hypothetical protein Tsb002_23970 [Wenzhouxiangellaceae bacterium]
MMTRTTAGWWLYVAITLSLGYGQTIRKLVTDTGGIVSRFGPAIAATILAAGIVALLLEKPILRRWFWKGVFATLVVSSVAALSFGLYLFAIQGLVSWPTLLLLGGAIYLIPGEVQLYRYAFGNWVSWPLGSKTGGV